MYTIRIDDTINIVIIFYSCKPCSPNRNNITRVQGIRKTFRGEKTFKPQ